MRRIPPKYKPKICLRCGRKYYPTSGMQRVCFQCRLEVGEKAVGEIIKKANKGQGGD